MNANKSSNLICHLRSILLIVDLQEKLLPVIRNREEILSHANRLLIGSELFDVPVIVSEQYPKGLGATVNDLNISQYQHVRVIEKTTFSCRERPDHFRQLKETGRDQVIVCGTESHICVLQSSLDLNAMGFQVFLVADAIGSRDPRNTELAIQRCSNAGITAVPTESVLFEWCEDSNNKAFKSVSGLVR